MAFRLFNHNIFSYLMLSVFTTAVIFNTGCRKDTATNTPNTPSPNFVGQTFEGGTVAYIFESGDPGYVAGESHGLIAAEKDLDSLAVWGKMNLWITGAHDTLLGYGQQNTMDILQYGDTVNTAAWRCNRLDVHTYDDWYLPSKNELEKLFLNKIKIGGFNYNASYWSSCQNNANRAWMRNFSTGESVAANKSTLAKARAVRSF